MNGKLTQEHIEMENFLNDKILELQGELLEIEMKLQDALTNSKKLFISKVKGIIDEMGQLNQDYNTYVLQEVFGFNEKFREAALGEQEKFAQQYKKAEDAGGDQIEIFIQEIEETLGKEYLEMMVQFGEIEALMTALENFKETTENRVQGYESMINNDIKSDWQAYENKLNLDQHTRNREIIQEIVENTAKFQAANHKQFTKWKEEDDQDN